MSYDIVNSKNVVLSKQSIYKGYLLKKNKEVLLVENIKSRTNSKSICNNCYFYIPEDDLFINPLTNTYALKRGKNYDLEPGYSEESDTLTISGNEPKIGFIDKISKDYFVSITNHRDYRFEYSLYEKKDIKIIKEHISKYTPTNLIQINMYKGDQLLHEVIGEVYYRDFLVRKIDGETIYYDKHAIDFEKSNKVIKKEKIYVPLKETKDIYLNKKVIKKDTWQNFREKTVLTNKLIIHISNKVKVMEGNAIYDTITPIIEIIYDGTSKEWRKIIKGTLSYSYKEVDIDYQHFKSYTEKSENWDNFIYTYQDVKIFCKDKTFLDDRERNKEDYKKNNK